MKDRPWLPYVAPMALYLVFLLAQSNANLLWLYPVKTVAVAGVLWWCRGAYTELRPGMSWLGILVGLIAIALWIFGDPLYPKVDALMVSFEQLLSRVFHSPPPVTTPAALFDPSGRYVFIAFRIVGAVLVVPVMEELFWRGFLIRWLVNEDFKTVPVGTFTWSSFLITVGLFGAEHNQWLAGLVCGALYNWLLYRTRSVWACVVAHATSNAVLAGWVLARGDWKFW